MRHARLPLLILVLFCTLCTPYANAAPARLAPIAPGLAAALDGALEAARIEARAPGALLAVALPGHDLYQGASGLANVAAGTPLLPDARVRVASVTKPFVAVVVLQLVQEGWLLLDHSVAHWLPGLLPGGERITVRQLLNHTSGLPDYLSDGLVERARREPERVWTPQELIALALRSPARFAPGAAGRWFYANTNYIVLGLVVERVTGNSLDQELRQRVIDPLGLRHAALAGSSADPGDLARGYVGTTDYTALNMSVAWAAGGVTASVADLARFTQALMWHELLRPETLNSMLSSTSTNNVWGVPDLSYGLGIMRRTLPGNNVPPELRLALGHTGSLSGYRTVMWYFPASGITIVAAMTRSGADPNPLVSTVLELLADQGML